MIVRTYQNATITILFLLFLLGLTTLDLPLLDSHDWRQAISTVVSQNFVRHGYDLFHPLYDICGSVSPDVFGIEFPIMNLLIAWMYEVFGWNIAYARGVNLVVSMLGLYYLYSLVTRLFSDRIGFYTTIFTAGSLNLMFSRKVMPDTFSLALVMSSIYYMVRYLERPSWKYIVAGTLLGLLGVGAKLPSVMLYCFLLFPFLEGDIFARAKVHVVIGMMVIAGMVALWYFMWVPHIEETYTCFPLMYPVSLREGLVSFTNSGGKIGFRFTRAYTWWGPLVLFILGLGKVLYTNKRRFAIFLFAYTLIMILYIAKTGRVFQNHNYYVIPAIPAMSLLIAYFLDSRVLHHWIYSVLIVFLHWDILCMISIKKFAIRSILSILV